MLSIKEEHLWTLDHSELVTFAGVLNDCGVFDAPKDVLDFFEKPHKWSPEHACWVDLGRPIELIDEERASILDASFTSAPTEPPCITGGASGSQVEP